MQKLCYICEATQGGVRKHLCELMRVFSRPDEGYIVHAILGDREEQGFREELAQIARDSGNLKFDFVPELKRSIHLTRDLKAYAAMKELLRGIQPDIIHTHSSKAGFLGRMAAHHLGLGNVVHTPHVFPFQWTRGMKGRIYLALERQAAKWCRTLVCVSESQRADAAARNLVSSDKLIVIRNGIELPPETSKDKRNELRARLDLSNVVPAVGMVARLAPQKGVGIFLQAAAVILKKRSEVMFLLVGGGPLEREIQERITELKLPSRNIRLLGHREDAQELYPAFDVLILSSLYEGLPYVLLEAMAQGIPVVATDVLGSRDVVVDGETGFLAPVSDPVRIAECALAVLNDAAMHERMGVEARKRVAIEFSLRTFVEGHRQLYRSDSSNLSSASRNVSHG